MIRKKVGGRREPPGGRPPKGNVRLVCYIQPETRKIIDEWAEKEGLTLGQVVDRLLANTTRNSGFERGSKSDIPHQDAE